MTGGNKFDLLQEYREFTRPGGTLYEEVEEAPVRGFEVCTRYDFNPCLGLYPFSSKIPIAVYSTICHEAGTESSKSSSLTHVQFQSKLRTLWVRCTARSIRNFDAANLAVPAANSSVCL